MTKGEQHPFGHQLFCLLWFATKTMNHPRLRHPTLVFAGGFKFTTQHQQFVECPHTMNDHRLLQLLSKGYLGTKGFHL
jgi:hypothetical protein